MTTIRRFLIQVEMCEVRFKISSIVTTGYFTESTPVTDSDFTIDVFVGRFEQKRQEADIPEV